MEILNNELLYEKLWRAVKVRDYKEYPEWQILRKFIKPKDKLLEFGSGARPRLPFFSSVFLDINGEAINRLKRLGVNAIKSSLEDTSFPDRYFDLVCGFDVLEHIEDDQRVLNEVRRILKSKGKFIFSVPLQKRLYNDFDRTWGHMKRYEAKELVEKLSRAKLKIIAISEHGLRSKSQFIDKTVTFFLTRVPELSIRVSDIFYGLSLKIAKKKIRLIEADFLEKMSKMHGVLVVAEKQND